MTIEFRKCEACGRSNRLTRKICFSCGANLSTGIVPPAKNEEPRPSPQSSSSEQDTGQRAVETVTDTDNDRKPLLGKIRAAFQWWAKHPWKVFWGILILPYLIFIPIAFLPESTLISLFEFDPDSQPGIFVLLLMVVVLIVFTLSQIVMYLSFSRGMFLMWKRSKIEVIVLGVVLAPVIWIILVQFSIMRTREYDSAVRVGLMFAANAQETYFDENGTYTNSVSDLWKILSGAGISHSSNVNLTIEATTTTFVITGKVKEGCSPNTGTWSYISTTGAIDGTPCSRP